MDIKTTPIKYAFTVKNKAVRIMKPKRKIKCPNCGEQFERFNTFQKYCFKSECLEMWNKVKREKERRRAVKEFKAEDRQWLTEVAQRQVNLYVRLRDKHSPCISCQAPSGFRIEAGHFRSSGNNHAIRFNTLNIHSQCHKCNCHLSANLVPYRENIIKKIGIEKVEWLESQTQTKKYSVEYLTKLIRVFRKKNKQMQSKI